MDSSGCKLLFPIAELKKCLEPRTFELWQKIAQAEDIAAAQLEGLEHCPNCDFCMIFEVGVDIAPVLTCLRSDCRFVSCRKCKKKVCAIMLMNIYHAS
jgi:E3 ubiquitin-protein ligase RNF216